MRSLIHVSGTRGGKLSRKQTGKSDWDEAKTVVSVWGCRRSLGMGKPRSKYLLHPIPGKDGIGLGDTGDLLKSRAAESLADLGEGGALGIRKANTGWKMSSEDAIFRWAVCSSFTQESLDTLTTRARVVQGLGSGDARPFRPRIAGPARPPNRFSMEARDFLRQVRK